MKNIKKLFLLMVAIFAVAVTTNTKASASSWHRGLPSVVKAMGTYDGYLDDNSEQTLTCYSNKLVYGRSGGWATTSLTNIYYKKLSSHYYLLTGTYRNGGYVKRHSHATLAVKRPFKATIRWSWSHQTVFMPWMQQ